MSLRLTLAAAWAVLALALPALAQDAPLESLPKKDRLAWIEAAKADGRTGIARKTAPVDARPAVPGEIVVTVIPGQGVETSSPPAQEGDWVVRNRCLASGNPQILVTAAKFPTRYGAPQTEPDKDGWREFRPTGADMVYAIVPEADGEFAIEAPWGELMRVLPGDAMVQVASDPNDTYRIDKDAFACTYEIVTPAGK